MAALAASCDESSVSQELSPAGVEGLHDILALEVWLIRDSHCQWQDTQRRRDSELPVKACWNSGPGR